MNRDYYKILIVGSSGRGKTYMFRDLDPNTTGFLNVEDKPLPFKNNWKFQKRPATASEALTTLVEYANNSDITTIVVDSFSAYMDMVLAEARATKRGFDIWSEYNEQIAKFHKVLNRINKEIFVTAHYEILNIEGAPEKRVKAQGKENEGQIEKHYTIVLYADNKFNEAGQPTYFLSTVGEGISAKCPPNIFDTPTIPNDGKFVLDKVVEFATK